MLLGIGAAVPLGKTCFLCVSLTQKAHALRGRYSIASHSGTASMREVRTSRSHVTRPLFPLTPFPSVCITRRDGEDTRFDRPSRTWPLRFPGPPPLTDRVDISVEGSFFLFFFTILLDLALLFFLAEVAPGVTVICCYRNRTKRSGITNSTTCKGHKKMHPRNVPYSPCPQQ